MKHTVDRGLADGVVGVLLDFALTMTTDPEPGQIVAFLADHAAEVLPVDAAAATVIDQVAAPLMAASDARILDGEHFQFVARDGPSWLTWASSVAIAIADLEADGRFPQFRRYGAAPGIRSVFTFPLRRGEVRLGALSLYRMSPGPLSPRVAAAAQTMADVAGAYLINAQRRRELLQASDLSRRAALHDSLTGLPNRTLMLERLEHAHARSKRTGRPAAVLYVDLDGFKTVNDTYGHAVGDQVLVAVADRLVGLLRPPDTLARLHGDEFVLLCEDLSDPDHAVQIGRRLQSALREPLALGDAEINLRASVGVVITDPDHQDPQAILRDADHAMYEAKRRGGAQFWVHDPHR